LATTLIQRAQTPRGRLEQDVNMVLERKALSEQHFTGIRREFPQLYDLYRGVLTGRFSPHKNNVHIPLIFSTIQSDVARKTSTSFGDWPIVRFVGYDPGDAALSKKREALVSAQMRDCSSFKKGYDVFLSADLYGTAVIQYGWNHTEEDMEVLDVTVLPLTGQIVETMKKQRTVLFDGPDWKVLDCLDLFPQPSFRTIDDMQWFITREYMDLDDIRLLTKPSIFGKSVFDPDEVDRMERDGAGAYTAGDDYKNWRTQGRTIYDNEARLREKYARPIEILHMWGTVPSELADDGIVSRVISIANGRYRLRTRPIPLWGGKKPFMAYSPMPDPHFFFAAGKAEVAKKLQIVANRFTNQQLDALDIFIDPAFFYNTRSGLNTRNLLMKPGRFIGLDGVPQESVQAVTPNFQGMQMGTGMTEQVWRWMQQGSGIVEDTVQGGGGQRQTAREFLGRSEAVATRLLMESRLFEESFLEPLADAFVDLNRQFLTKPREVFILGDRANTDPDTGEPIPTATRQMVSGWDLVPNYEAHATGATSALNRAGRQQNLTFLMQAASANPMVASAVNWIAFFRQIFREFEIDNVNELLASPAQQMAMLQQAQGGAQAQQGAGPAPMGPGQGTPQGGPSDVGPYRVMKQEQRAIPGTPGGVLAPGELPVYPGQGIQ